MAGLRSVLEVLKWTDYPDLHERINRVNRLWHTAAASDEVWDVLCEAYDFDSTHTEPTSKVSFYKQLLAPTICMMSGGQLRGFNARKRQLTSTIPVNLAKNFDRLSSFSLYLPYIVATGATEATTGQSALIHLTTRVITLLPDMLQPRYRHGSLVYKASVYVFGGTIQDRQVSNQAEKLNLLQPVSWTELPNLLCELAFSTPCRKGSSAYLFGGWGTDRCQRFDLVTETFHFLPFLTPMQGYLTTSFVYENEIYFLQSGHMCRWQGVDSADVVVQKFPEPISSNW